MGSKKKKKNNNNNIFIVWILLSKITQIKKQGKYYERIPNRKI
jgi:hypothetical protein